MLLTFVEKNVETTDFHLNNDMRLQGCYGYYLDCKKKLNKFKNIYVYIVVLVDFI